MRQQARKDIDQQAGEKTKALQTKVTDRLEAELGGLRQELDQANADLRSAEAEFERTRALQGYEIVRAPFDAVVTARYVDPGALLTATASGQPVVEVADPARVRVFVNAGQDVALAPPSAVAQLSQDPTRRTEVILVVLDGLVLQGQAEPDQQVVDVVAVLLLLGLAEDHEPAAVAHEVLDGIELLGAQARRAGAGRPLPPRVGGMRDHEQVVLTQELPIQGLPVVTHDFEAVAGERRRRNRVGGIARVRGLHRPPG